MTIRNKSAFQFDPKTYAGLDKLGRIPLSKHFHLREFLYSEVAIFHNIPNVPDRIEDAVMAGSKLCELLLEPLQEKFGRIHVRSGYRSQKVNEAGKEKNCATNNDGFHTWDRPHDKHGIGATACISIPSLSEKVMSGEIEYQAIAWWIVDHLPDWSFIEFFSTPSDIAFANEICFNIGWHQHPMHSITSWRGGPRNLHATIPDAETRKLMWGKIDKN